MADAATGDTSSTPTAAAVAPSANVDASAPTAPVAATTETPVAVTPAPATSTPAPATAPIEPVAFNLPDDMKLAPEAVEKFRGFVTAKLPGADGKFSLTAQELVDVFADQARGANQRWKDSQAAQDKAWEAESKTRFTAPQLANAETGIGFLTSYEPSFRDLAKSFRNNPSFVNAMRVIGERLSEDNFEIAGSAAPTQPTKSRAERMGYVKAKT